MMLCIKSLLKDWKEWCPKYESAFISKRLIFYNIIVAYKALHPMKFTKVGKEWSMAIKLEISKAYDRVFEKSPNKLGFRQKLVSLTM